MLNRVAAGASLYLSDHGESKKWQEISHRIGTGPGITLYLQQTG